MDPELMQILGYSAFNPPSNIGLGQPRVPTGPVFRPSVDMPIEAYGGTPGPGEMAGATLRTPTPPGRGMLSSLISFLTPEAPQLTSSAVASPASTDPLAGAVPPQEAYRSQPFQTPPEEYRTQPYQAPVSASTVGAPASLGASLEPSVPMPRPRPAEAPQGGRGSLSNAKAISDTLKGVVPPQAPSAQKVSTPHAPTLAKLQGGNIAELLASLGIGPQQAFPGLKLPSTLGQALGGR